ncbi:MAG TPA: hypothetical protein VGV38_00985 [Pyrinomonadaceae bacterium]|nr:hypothetical protein [Pyrinomonadaceae bacterium]
MKTTKRGGRTPICVTYWTCRRDCPPLTGAGAVGAPGRATARSKKSLSCEVGMRRARASSARRASGSRRSTR